MILVRNVFRLKFGKAREAKALWQEGLDLMRASGNASRETRLLTDLTGPFYTFVVEDVWEDLAAMDAAMTREMARDDWRAFYARFTPLVESGYREVFTIVGSNIPSLGTAAAGATATQAR